MAVEAQVQDIRYMSSVDSPHTVVQVLAERHAERFGVEVVCVAVSGDRICCMGAVLLRQSRRRRLDCAGGWAAAGDFLSGLDGLLERPELTSWPLSTPWQSRPG
jgi:hypothetical protein